MNKSKKFHEVCFHETETTTWNSKSRAENKFIIEIVTKFYTHNKSHDLYFLKQKNFKRMVFTT